MWWQSLFWFFKEHCFAQFCCFPDFSGHLSLQLLSWHSRLRGRRHSMDGYTDNLPHPADLRMSFSVSWYWSFGPEKTCALYSQISTPSIISSPWKEVLPQIEVMLSSLRSSHIYMGHLSGLFYPSQTWFPLHSPGLRPIKGSQFYICSAPHKAPGTLMLPHPVTAFFWLFYAIWKLTCCVRASERLTWIDPKEGRLIL